MHANKVVKKTKEVPLIATKYFHVIWFYYRTVKHTFEKSLKKIMQTTKRSKINKAEFTKRISLPLQKSFLTSRIHLLSQKCKCSLNLRNFIICFYTEYSSLQKNKLE